MTKTSTLIKTVIAGCIALLIGVCAFAQTDGNTTSSPRTTAPAKSTSSPVKTTVIHNTPSNTELKLVKQTLVYNGGKVYVNWVVPSNSPDCIYVIERSLDGNEYEPLGLKEGIQSPLELLYSWIDNKPVEGVAHYRIKRVNNEGEVLGLSTPNDVTTPAPSMLIRDNSQRAAFAK